MKKIHKNIIFISFILLCFLGVFFVNYSYYIDMYDLKNEEQYHFIFGFDRNYVNVRLKATSQKRYEKLIVGSSVTCTLMKEVSSRYKIPLIFLQNLSYKEHYEILKTFIYLHPELKTVYFPLEYHSFLFDRDKTEPLPEFDYKKNLSVREIISAYFGFKTTISSIRHHVDKIKDNFVQQESENDVPEGITIIPKNRISPEPYNHLSEEQIKEDMLYFEKILDLLQKKQIDVVSYTLPANYVYLQDALTPEKIKIVEDVKRLVVSKGIKIYDFTKKNRYNTQRLDETCLFFDVMHPNELYGNIVYKNLTKQKDDKSLYRVITESNLKECNKLSLKELEEYRKTYKDYIDEYFEYDYWVDFYDPKNQKFIPLSDIPKEIIEY